LSKALRERQGHASSSPPLHLRISASHWFGRAYRRRYQRSPITKA
jgi:hypothetical protein